MNKTKKHNTTPQEVCHETRPNPSSERTCYILVASDVHVSLKSTPSAFDVADYCLKRSLWGVGPKRASGFAVGSPVLIYLAGKRDSAQSFIAEAVVSGEMISNRLMIGDRLWLRTIPLKSIRRYEKPVHVHRALKILGFTENRWGSRFQGGVVKINREALLEIRKIAGEKTLHLSRPSIEKC